MIKIRIFILVLVLLGKIVAVPTFAADIDTSNTNSKFAKDRKIVLTSDGKIVAFYCKGTGTYAGPLYYSISSDGGNTWTTSVTIGGGVYFANNSSVWRDGSDNIYVVYQGVGGTPSYHIDMRKMTYSGGSYTLDTERTIEATDSINDDSWCSITRESGGRIWVAYVVRATNTLRIRYSDTDGASWIDTDTTPFNNYTRPVLVLRNNLPFLIMKSNSLYSSSWNGSSWTTSVQIPGTNYAGGGDELNYSVCVTSNNYVHIVFQADNNPMNHTYYDGTNWLTTPLTVDTASKTNPAVTTDGTNLWAFWSSNTTGAADIMYKRYNGSMWDGTATNVTNNAGSGTNNYRVGTIYFKSADNAIVPFFWYAGTADPYSIKFSKLGFTPSVSSVNPPNGLNTQQTTITIVGQGFFGGIYSSDITSVKLDDPSNTILNISSATVSDLTIANVIVPTSIKTGTYNIKVTTSKGTNTTSTQKFIVTTNVVPTVTNVTPDIVGNTGGAEISIIGTGFFGGSTSPDVNAITLYSTSESATVTIGTVVSDTLISNCITPAVSVGTYDVQVRTSGGNNSTSTVKLKVKIGPTVTTITPSTNSNTNSTTMTITGTRFYGDVSSNDVQWIKIKSIDGLYQKNFTSFGVITDSTITGAVLPNGSHANTYDVIVRTNSCGENSTSAQKFIVTTTEGPPTITNLVPDTGNNLDANTINIYGAGFFGGTAVNEDDVRVIKLSPGGTVITKGTVTNDTSIINCIVPSGVTKGTYDVIVTTGGGSNSTSLVKYKVGDPLPIVSNINPNTGPNSSQITGVIITGQRFTGVTAITLSGSMEVNIGSFNPTSDTLIEYVVIPSHILAGTYDVRIATANNGTNTTSAVKWISTTSKPTLAGISPGTGLNVLPVTIAVSGTGFYGGTDSTPNVINIRMYKGAFETSWSSCTVLSDTMLQTTIPTGLSTGTYDIKVSNNGGESDNSVKFTVITSVPQVTQITPSSGLLTISTTITIIGSGFYGGTQSTPNVLEIKLLTDTVTCTPTGYTVVSDTEIRNVVLPLSGLSGLVTGRYPIYVTTVGGISSGDKTFDVLFDHTAQYDFTKNDIKFSIPANTFSSDVALIVNTILPEPESVKNADKLKYKNIKIRKELSSTLREIITSNTNENIGSGKSIAVRYGYGSSNINDSVIEKVFRVISLGNDGKWEFVSGEQTVDLSTREVICNLTHLSVFKIGQYVSPADSLSNVVVYPNPMDFGTGTRYIKFVNLTADPTLKVYTISGELVKEIGPNTIENAGNDGRIEWDGRNDNGEVIARGLYIYIVTDGNNGRKVGKFAVK